MLKHQTVLWTDLIKKETLTKFNRNPSENLSALLAYIYLKLSHLFAGWYIQSSLKMKTYTITSVDDGSIENPALNGTVKHPVQQSRTEFNETLAGNIHAFFVKNRRSFKNVRNFVFLLLYLGYYGYAMYCNFGDEGSIRLTVFTAFGLLYLGLTKLQKSGNLKRSCKTFLVQIHAIYSEGRRPTIIRWFVLISVSSLGHLFFFLPAIINK